MKFDLTKYCHDCLPLYYIITKMRPVVTDYIPTMGVDKNGTLLINEDWLEQYAKVTGYSKENLFAIVLRHEAMHIFLKHFDRFPKANEKSNVACDCEINTRLLKDHPKLTENNQAIMPKQFKLPDNKTAEYYFDHLPKNLDKPNDQYINVRITNENGEKTQVQVNMKRLGEMLDEKDVEKIIEKLEKSKGQKIAKGEVTPEVISRAYEINEKMPQGVKIQVPEHNNITLDELFVPLLQRFLGGSARISTWSRPSRRFRNSTFFHKGYTRKCARVLLAFDVSGSIPLKTAEQSAVIAQKIIKKLEQEIDWCYFSDEVSPIFKNKRKINLEYVGSGTNGQEVVNKFHQGHWDKLLIFTDGCCHWENQPNKDILVIRIEGGDKTPFEEFDVRKWI